MTLTKIKNCFNGPLPASFTDDELYKYFLDNIYNGDLKIYGTNIKTFTTPIENNRMLTFIATPYIM